MDAKLLQRVMDLADRTGDRVIVVNPQKGTAHAVVPFDAYEELVAGVASLRDLEDDYDDEIDFDNDLVTGDEIDELNELDLDAITKEAIREVETKAVSFVPEALKKPVTEEEIIQKVVEESQKEASGLTPLDVLDDEANEEQYYLEPLE